MQSIISEHSIVFQLGGGDGETRDRMLGGRLIKILKKMVAEFCAAHFMLVCLPHNPLLDTIVIIFNDASIFLSTVTEW